MQHIQQPSSSVCSTFLVLNPLQFTRIRQISLKRRYPASTASPPTVPVALAQAISRCRLTAEVRFRSQARPCRYLWQRDRFLSRYFSFPLSVSFHQCSTFINSSPTDAVFLFTMAQQPLVRHGLLIIADSRSHSVGLLWTSDQPDAETST
jgi:hypothetical protein